MRALIGTLALSLLLVVTGNAGEHPDTGISGVYEVMVGVRSAEPALEYFAQFGFTEVASAELSAAQAASLYGVDSALRSYRLQNGEVDAHGLVRLLEWAQPTGPGVGYAPSETVGMRIAVMRTRDIVRIADVFADLRDQAEQPWLLAGPVYDDLYDATEGTPSIVNRRVGVREMAIYGSWFNHVFFQRYGYTIPGYGVIGDHSPLGTSEFTHHSFIVAGDLREVTDYYESVFGFISENDPVISGDWQKGPQAVFLMEPGRSHWYRGFVSPNDVSGKLKFFSVHGLHTADDRSERQRPGELGITLHSLWTPRLGQVHRLALEAGLNPRAIERNEFEERSFVVRGPDGAAWQIVEREGSVWEPVTEFQLIDVNN
ncbi:MAG: hypothetical protein OXF72_12245 [Gammaproteobacteria bacterium]|nr:hypothetical protein [Gammaproteobacteria bacterium]MCY4322130.1 hypothetical protein [Gammaproteobacteria bacterium]